MPGDANRSWENGRNAHFDASPIAATVMFQAGDAYVGRRCLAVRPDEPDDRLRALRDRGHLDRRTGALALHRHDPVFIALQASSLTSAAFIVFLTRRYPGLTREAHAHVRVNVGERAASPDGVVRAARRS